MTTNSTETPSVQPNFQHQQVRVDDISIHTVSIGQAGKPAVVFLHGFPQNWLAFRHVMTALSDTYHTIAIDLPGIGQSDKIAANDTTTIARYVHGLIDALNLSDVTLVGHDMGGMVTYSFLHAYPDQLARAVIMNVAIPGIDPWAQIRQNPQIWHFTFNAIPDLPEALVAGKQRVYFDFFFNTIAARPDRIDEQARNAYAEAYSDYGALHTGFEWYRAFPQAEKENASTKGTIIHTPVLYIRGEREYGKIEDYLKSFRESGLVAVQGEVIPGSGHYAPEEAAPEVAGILRAFMGG